MFFVDGTLLAQGTNENPITFTRNNDEGTWGVIYFNTDSADNSVLSNCNIEFCNAIYTNDIYYGGVSFRSSSGVIENCNFTNCFAGLVSAYSSSPTLLNNRFAFNYEGGVLCWQSSSTQIINNEFYGNIGYGIRCYQSSPQITNNTISFSGSRNYQSQNFHSKDFNLESEMIFQSNNRNYLYGLYLESSSNPSVQNNIIYANGIDDEGENIYISGSSPMISYSLLSDETLPTGAIDGGSNIYNQNPIFTDPANFDFSLQTGSPCINTANPDTTGLNLPEFDLADNQRICDSIIDIGAYEHQIVIGIDSPQNIQITTSENSVILSWDVVISANSYIVFSSDSPTGTYSQISGNQSEFSINGGRVSWSQSVNNSKKFYYVKASTEDYPTRFKNTNRSNKNTNSK